MILFFAVLCAVQSGGSNGGASGNSLNENSNGTPQQQQQQQPRGPHFDTSASKNVTALLGKTAYLNCRVKNLSNKTVSYHILHFSSSFELKFACVKRKLFLVATTNVSFSVGKVLPHFPFVTLYVVLHNARHKICMRVPRAEKWTVRGAPGHKVRLLTFMCWVRDPIQDL